jgi:lysophospholipase L1-like esterase
LFAIGDSYTGYNNYQGTPVSPSAASSWAINYTQAYGYIEWTRALDPRFAFDNWYDTTDPTGRNISGANEGIFGAHLEWNNEDPSGILTRLPAVLARKPNLLILQGGSNTINSGDIAGSSVAGNFADIVGKLDKGIRLARNEGVWVILPTLYLRGDWPVGDARYRTLAAVNNWIRAQKGRDGIAAILDANAVLSPGDIQDLSMFQPDKVHLSPKGALIVGRDYFLPIMRQVVSAGSTFDQNPSVSNLYQLTLANLTGTAGAKGTAVVSGSIADGLRINAVRNASVVACSKADLGSGLSGQVLDISPVDNNSAAYGQIDITFPQMLTSGSMVVGEWLYHAIFLEQLSGQQLSTARLQLQLRNGSTVVETAFAMNTASPEFATPVPSEAGAGWWIKSNPMRLPSDIAFTNVIATLNIFYPKSGSPFQIRLSRPMIRKVDDPRPIWGYTVD